MPTYDIHPIEYYSANKIVLSPEYLTTKDITDLLVFLKKHPEITELKIYTEQIEDEGARMLARALADKNSNFMLDLTFSGTEGAFAFYVATCPTRSKLETTTLSEVEDFYLNPVGRTRDLVLYPTVVKNVKSVAESLAMNESSKIIQHWYKHTRDTQENKRTMNLEKTAMRLLKDATPTPLLDPKNSQVVVYRPSPFKK